MLKKHSWPGGPGLDMSLMVPRIPFPLQHFVICLLLNITWRQFRGCSVLSLDHRNWTCHGNTYSSHGDRLLCTFCRIWRFPLHLDCSAVTKATSPDRYTAPGGFSASQQGETSPTLKSIMHFPFSSGPVILWFFVLEVNWFHDIAIRSIFFFSILSAASVSFSCSWFRAEVISLQCRWLISH